MKRRYKHTDELRKQYAERAEEIRAVLGSYRAVPAEKYFYELCFCLMTPQSSAANAFDAQKQLEALRFRETETDPEEILRRGDFYIRFHKTKAKRLIRLKSMFEDVMSVIANPKLSAFEKREWLASQIDGLSYKEATHFLRNIGMNDGLAILDVHILRCLVKHGVIGEMPPSLSKSRYLEIEASFQDFASSLSVSVDELDLVFWSAATGFILK
ncbi:MAG TPA: DNA lyase [Bacteroidota bacterium]|nr:DNA lyase [Bacteroidota bacterium]